MTNAKFTLDGGVSTNACHARNTHNHTETNSNTSANSPIKPSKPVKKAAQQHKPRRLKVRKSFYNPPRRHPFIPYSPKRKIGTRTQLLLQGVWLNAAGFTADSYVTVEVKQDQLIITTENSLAKN